MNQTMNDKFRAAASGTVMTSFVSRHALQDRWSCCPGQWTAARVINPMPTNYSFGWRRNVILADE